MDDAWLHVFGCLPARELLKCATICHQWNTLALTALRSQRHLFYDDDLSELEERQRIEVIIGQIGSRLRSIEFASKIKDNRFAAFASTQRVGTFALKTLVEHATQLTSIKFTRVILTLGALDQLRNLPETIEELAIVNCTFDCASEEANDLVKSSLRQLFAKSRSFRKFELTCRASFLDHFRFDDELMAAMPETTEALLISAGNHVTNVDCLKGLNRLTSFRLNHSLASSISSLSSCKESLKHLDLANSAVVASFAPISAFSQLQQLTLSNNRDSLRDADLVEILQSCKELRDLSIDNCAMLSSTTLCLLGTLPTLTKLCANGLSGLTDEDVNDFTTSKTLQHLEIEFCSKISGDVLSQLRANPSIQHFRPAPRKTFQKEQKFPRMGGMLFEVS